MADVVVVEDDFMVAAIHARFVARVPDHEVVASVRTGTEALEAVASLEPDVVLLDVHLPDMSGVEVLRRLRASGSTAEVVVVTAAREADTVRAALHGGAAAYLIKPFEFEDLASRLGELARRREALASGPTDQGAVDALFGAAPAGRASAAEPPKGLSTETQDLVVAALREHGDLSAAECGEHVGLSRVSARRYLEHLVTSGRAQVRLRYGRTGRPERRYSPR
ncbi:response regulator [Solicola sp. PLA-1-18]|uniref:response regulator n=1 Tax=Solicola sp. PLA-1-18 TaxID=3380532 RepID=UPI003B7A54DE